MDVWAARQLPDLAIEVAGAKVATSLSLSVSSTVGAGGPAPSLQRLVRNFLEDQPGLRTLTESHF